MRTISILVILAIFGSIISDAERNEITDITDPASKTGKVGIVPITFTVAQSKLADGDFIILSKTDSVQANDPKATVASLSGTSHSAQFTFITGGIYKVFVQKADMSNPILQDTSGLLMTIAGPTAITAITSPSNQKGKVGIVSITFAVDNTQLENGDTIIMSTTTGLDTDPKTTVSGLIGPSYTAEFTFALAGEYKVFVKKTNNTATEQTNVKITITDLGSDLVTKVEATDPKAKVATTFKFSLKAGGLLKGDKLYLSTSKTDTVGSDGKCVLLDKNENGPTLEKVFTLASAGSYSVFITRGIETIKQMADAITVASSGFVSMALTLGFVFLLF